MPLRRMLVAAALMAGGFVSENTADAQPKGGAPRPFNGPGPVGQGGGGLRTARPINNYNNWAYGPGAGISVGLGWSNNGPAYGAVSVGPGFGFGPGFYGNGFGYGYGGYNGFYSNGFTAYGPPVPTYGPIPGSFGGSDQRLNNGGGTSNWQPFGATAIFPLNDRTIQVQPAQPVTPFPGQEASPLATQSVEPSRIPATPLPGQADPNLLPTVAPLLMDVTVPDGAKVSVDGKETKQTGTNRIFQSPDKKLGEELKYELTAEWSDNGIPMRRVKMVVGRAGERIAVDFTKDE